MSYSLRAQVATAPARPPRPSSVTVPGLESWRTWSRGGRRRRRGGSHKSRSRKSVASKATPTKNSIRYEARSVSPTATSSSLAPALTSCGSSDPTVRTSELSVVRGTVPASFGSSAGYRNSMGIPSPHSTDASSAFRTSIQTVDLYGRCHFAPAMRSRSSRPSASSATARC